MKLHDRAGEGAVSFALSLIALGVVSLGMRELAADDRVEPVDRAVAVDGEPAWAATPAPDGPLLRLRPKAKPRAADLVALERHLRDHHAAGARIYRRGAGWIVVAPIVEPDGCPFLDGTATRVAALASTGPGRPWSLAVEDIGSARMAQRLVGSEVVRIRPARPVGAPPGDEPLTVAIVTHDEAELARLDATFEPDGGLVLRRARDRTAPLALPEGVDVAELVAASAFATRWRVVAK